MDHSNTKTKKEKPEWTILVSKQMKRSENGAFCG